MFNFFNRKKRGQGTNAVVLSSEGIAHACISRTIGQPPTLNSFHFAAIDNPAETSRTFKQFTQQNSLQDIPLFTCLHATDANLVMLEKPEVADNELRQAMRWRVKDSLPFDIEDAIVDVFEIPGQKERGRLPLVYVTAAKKELLKQKLSLFQEQELEVECIDIAELAMRNIAALLPEDQQGVALLKLDASSGLMTLTQDSALYLARNVDVGYTSLSASPSNSLLGEAENEGGLALEQGLSQDQQRSLDAIVLEVQRSLDYYESHFAKPAINSLVIAPLPYEIPGMINQLASALGLQVRLMDLNAVLDTPTPIGISDQANCFFAIGTALRDDSVVASNHEQGEAA